MRPVAAFSRTNCARPTIALRGTICIMLVCLTTRMNPSIQSAQPWRSLYITGITTTHSWAWGCNTHCWVFTYLSEKVNIAFQACRWSWNWRMWFSGIQRKSNTGTEGFDSCKVLSTSFSSLCVFWTEMLWDSGIIPSLAFVHSTLQSSSRTSTEARQWNGWR